MAPALPAGFRAPKHLSGDEHAGVFAAEREGDGRSVVLKIYPPDRHSVEAARREFEVLRALQHPGIVSALDLVQDGDVNALVLEHVPGVTVEKWVGERLPDPTSVLRFAAGVAEALVHMHERHYVHRDLSPANVLIEPTSLATTLIDFGLTRPLGTATRPGHSRFALSGIAGTLPYMAPEQTGRMSRGWDQRSDLYSFGAILYFVLTGRPPFEGTDALQLIHSHIARTPTDPRQYRPEIPAVLARLVLVLLQKEPSDRYLSARALHADLTALRDRIEADGELPGDAPLPHLEAASSRLRFAARLYGREHEQAQLGAALDGARSGRSGSVLLSGRSGCGKSTLVDGLRPLVAAAGGHLVTGKCDRSRVRPFGAWISILESLTHQLLLTRDDELQRRVEALRTGVGRIAQALVDLVPDLSFLFGEVSSIPPLGPAETQERLALALTRFIRALATPEHPLVVLLDDLHVADPGSLFLAELVLAADPAPSGLLWIGAYREEEVGADHPLFAWMHGLECRGIGLTLVHVGPLGEDELLEMLADTLQRDRDDVRSLAQDVEIHTGNTPFLIRELLENLHAQGLLRCTSAGWVWDEAVIRALPVPEHAVDVMIARLRRLDAETARTLRFAACVGDEFDLDLLLALGCGPREQVATALSLLLEERLMQAAPGGFRFAHDRIREAAEALIDPIERAQLHLKTGRFLLETTPEPELGDRAFLVAEHLNLGRAWLPEELRLPALRVNLLAGQRALASGAAASAATFFAIGRELLQADDWERDRPLELALHLRAAESEFLCSRYARSLDALTALDHRALHTLERVQVQVRRILILAMTGSPEEAVAYAIECLRGYGVHWSLRPWRIRVWAELYFSRWLLDRTRYGLDWKPIAQATPEWMACLMISVAASALGIRTDVGLSALIACRAVREMALRGSAGKPAMALVGYAITELTLGGNPRRALRAGQAALAWLDGTPAPELRSQLDVVEDWQEQGRKEPYDLRIDFSIRALVYPWVHRRHLVLEPLDRIAEFARELGDPEFAYYADLNQSVYLALAGAPVAAIDARLRAMVERVLRHGQSYPEAQPCQRVHALLLEERDIERAIESTVQELREPLDRMPPSGSVYVRTLWLQVLCVYGRYDLAFEESERARPYLRRVVPFVHVADHTLYRGLAASALLAEHAGGRRRTLHRALAISIRHMERWAKWGPDFVHMAAFLRAERAALGRQGGQAFGLYEQAARGAQQQGFLHHAALAHERRAVALKRARRLSEAARALDAARAAYSRWGCPARARQLGR